MKTVVFMTVAVFDRFAVSREALPSKTHCVSLPSSTFPCFASSLITAGASSASFTAFSQHYLQVLSDYRSTLTDLTANLLQFEHLFVVFSFVALSFVVLSFFAPFVVLVIRFCVLSAYITHLNHLTQLTP